MLSIREELQKLAPADLNGGPEISDELPADLVREWQRIAAGIADIAAGQRKSAEQLEGFLQSVRSAAAETQRAAASSLALIDDHRASLDKDRSEHVSQSAASITALADASRQQVAEAARQSVVAVQASATTLVQSVADTLAGWQKQREEANAADAAHRTEIVRLISETRDRTLERTVPEMRAAVDEVARLASAAMVEQGRATVDQVRALVTQVDAASKARERIVEAHLERAHADLTAARADAERAEDQLRATSTSMMAFLEALDDVAALPSRDSATQATLGKLTARAQRVLQAAGLTEIEADGAALNEELHEVVERIPASNEFPAGRVTKVVQRGFRSGDRVLRRAQVVVAE